MDTVNGFGLLVKIFWELDPDVLVFTGTSHIPVCQKFSCCLNLLHFILFKLCIWKSKHSVSYSYQPKLGEKMKLELPFPFFLINPDVHFSADFPLSRQHFYQLWWVWRLQKVLLEQLWQPFLR